MTKLQDDFTSSKVHQGKGDYLITSTLGYSSSWCQATIRNNEILVQHWSIRFILPLNFAFDGRFFINIGESKIRGFTFWIVGLLHHDNITITAQRKGEPNGITLRETKENQNASIYYTEYSKRSQNHFLYKDNISIKFYSNGLLKTTIGKNCGTNIVVNSEIIVVSCPSSTSSTTGIISVYKESDLHFIHTQTYTTTSYSIGDSISIVSSKYYVSRGFN